jgi:fermentation-respiration switch protein FrsA (DUF1100 family)
VRPRGGRFPHGPFGPATLKEVIAFAAIAYLAVAVLVWAAQEQLIFERQPVSGAPSAPRGWSLEQVAIDARDGTRLTGVLARPPLAKAALVIYFPGNAQEATSQAVEADHYGERAVLLMNYRGYGASGGKPGERSLVGDAIEVYDWAVRRTDIDASRIVAHGRSLGSGVAVQLAAARPLKAMLLTSPYDSLAAIAHARYPWLPTSLLLRHRFDSLAIAPSLRLPALFLVAERDTLVPPAHSQRLAEAWAGPTERLAFAGRGHNDLEGDPRYLAAIRDFLDRHL